jgi:hypothetical protein
VSNRFQHTCDELFGKEVEMTSVLIVVSAADRWTLKDGSGHPTGYWAEELAEPHKIFAAAGWDITIATGRSGTDRRPAQPGFDRWLTD